MDFCRLIIIGLCRCGGFDMDCDNGFWLILVYVFRVVLNVYN